MIVDALAPVHTVDLFAPLHGELLSLLRRLDPDDWQRPTAAGSWRVKDVVAHLLDGDLRRLSGARDAHRFDTRPVTSNADIVALVDDLNRSGVDYAQRLSPQVMVDLLAVTGPWVARYFQSLDPYAAATWPVSWAGESRSTNWMDIGRDFTERWHHQQQIRDAVGEPLLLASPWLAPVLDVSVRALPVAYRDVDAAPGTCVVFEVVADERFVWTVRRDASTWAVWSGEARDPGALVRADADVVWRILYKALSFDAARQRVQIEGDERLATPLLRARSILTAG